jgi:DNA-binding transcriptional MerR regulator
MRIGELAKSVNVNVETVRYYQRIGLLELPQKPYGGTRYYSSEDLKRLRFIRRAQQIGFSLEDIRLLLIAFRAFEFQLRASWKTCGPTVKPSARKTEAFTSDRIRPGENRRTARQTQR